MKTVQASVFKARCLAILDEVERTGNEIAISKRGRVVARLLPPHGAQGKQYPQHRLRGTGKSTGNIADPPLPENAWEALADLKA